MSDLARKGKCSAQWHFLAGTATWICLDCHPLSARAWAEHDDGDRSKETRAGAHGPSDRREREADRDDERCSERASREDEALP